MTSKRIIGALLFAVVVVSALAAHAVDNPDAGYTISLWESEAAMRSYENGEMLQNTILPRLKPFFSGDYATMHCEVRLAEEFD